MIRAVAWFIAAISIAATGPLTVFVGMHCTGREYACHVTAAPPQLKTDWLL